MTGGIKGSTAGTGRTQEVEGSLGPYNVMRGLKRNPSSPRIETERRGGNAGLPSWAVEEVKGQASMAKVSEGDKEELLKLEAILNEGAEVKNIEKYHSYIWSYLLSIEDNGDVELFQLLGRISGKLVKAEGDKRAKYINYLQSGILQWSLRYGEWGEYLLAFLEEAGDAVEYPFSENGYWEKLLIEPEVMGSEAWERVLEHLMSREAYFGRILTGRLLELGHYSEDDARGGKGCCVIS